MPTTSTSFSIVINRRQSGLVHASLRKSWWVLGQGTTSYEIADIELPEALDGTPELTLVAEALQSLLLAVREEQARRSG